MPVVARSPISSRPRFAGHRPLRARQARRGGAARARARARRQARVERGAVRPVPGGARGASRGRRLSSTATRTAARTGSARPSPSGTTSASRRSITGAGADGMIDCLSQIFLDPRRRDRLRLAVVRQLRDRRAQARRGPAARPAARAPLRPRGDARARSAPRTKLAYLCLPNNPTGTTNTRAEVDAWFERVPEHVVTVVDQAYFEYIDEPGLRRRGRRSTSRQGRNVVVLRTFSKIYGLAGLRVGYAVGPADVVTEIVQGAARLRRRPHRRRRRRSRASTTTRSCVAGAC